MLPTLQLQDRILVEKLRPKFGTPLQPGAIVVFHPPQVLLEAGYDPAAALIKRVVAVGGDEVEVKDGALWRNGSPVQPDWSSQELEYSFGPIRLGDDQLLVLGDNRNESLDSHLWGPLPSSELIGTAVWRYWPLQRFGPLRFSTNKPEGQI